MAEKIGPRQWGRLIASVQMCEMFKHREKKKTNPPFPSFISYRYESIFWVGKSHLFSVWRLLLFREIYHENLPSHIFHEFIPRTSLIHVIPSRFSSRHVTFSKKSGERRERRGDLKKQTSRPQKGATITTGEAASLINVLAARSRGFWGLDRDLWAEALFSDWRCMLTCCVTESWN